MKKMQWMILLVLVLTLALGASAFAQVTAVNYDGKTYSFTGDAPTFVADGKTFIVHEDSIQIKEEGKADVFLPMESSMATAINSGRQVEYMDTARAFSSTISETVAVTEEAVESAVTTTISHTPLDSYTTENRSYDEYAQYGLSYDAAKDDLYYQGKLVRLFTDGYPIGDYGYCMIEHFDEDGTVDVKASRDLSAVTRNPDGSYDPSGKLLGLRVTSDADFAARDLTEWTKPTMSTVSSEGEPMSPQDKQIFYAPYADLGLNYDVSRDILSYQGQTVRRFLDVQQSNGESFSGGRFAGTMTQISQDYGDVDVTILRDYTQPDAEGNGKVIGVSVEAAN